MKKIIIIAVCLMIYIEAIAQGFSAIYRYTNLKGDHVVFRTDQTRTYFVTTYRSNPNWSCFIIKNGSNIRYYDMRECYENTPLTYGYLVNDMQVLGYDCYFCGKKWFYTGEIIYYPNGTMEFEVDSMGFFGKFNVNDVLSGTGTYEILEVTKTKTLNKLAVFPGGATAVGVSDSMDHSCLVELHETGVVGGVMTYRTRVLHSTIPDEVFMDVVHTSTKSTTVSRYNNPQNPGLYNYCFGLRTGSPMNLWGTNIGIYNYNTFGVLNFGVAGFTGVDPVCLSSVNYSEAVTVSYLMSSQPQVSGKVISYRIEVPGQQTTWIQHTDDNYRYGRIREAKFNMPLNFYTRMAMLLEDRDGRSVVRFPYWNMNLSYNDTMVYSDSVTIQSIAPFQYSSGTLDLAMGGYYHDNMNKIAELRNHDVHNGMGTWPNYSCQPLMYGSWKGLKKTVTPSLDEKGLHKYGGQDDLTFKQFNFISHLITPGIICEH